MKITYVIAVLLLAASVHAHGDVSVWEQLGVYDPVTITILAASVSLVFLAHAVSFKNKMSRRAQKFSFATIAVPIILGTIYLSAATVYLNVASATGGPVHWHADYEVWICGTSQEIVDPHAFDNKVGEPTVHEHNDNRIHIEGVLLHLEDASLGEFFEAVGGEFTKDYLSIPTNEGVVNRRNGDMCNGLPGRWMTFVNGKLNAEMDEYTVSPYTDVPPGDRIKLVFDSRQAQQINPNIGFAP